MCSWVWINADYNKCSPSFLYCLRASETGKHSMHPVYSITWLFLSYRSQYPGHESSTSFAHVHKSHYLLDVMLSLTHKIPKHAQVSSMQACYLKLYQELVLMIDRATISPPLSIPHPYQKWLLTTLFNKWRCKDCHDLILSPVPHCIHILPTTPPRQSTFATLICHLWRNKWVPTR